MRAAHFVGGPVTGPVILVLLRTTSGQRHQHVPESVVLADATELDSLSTPLPPCNREHCFICMEVSNFAPLSTTWCDASCCRHCRLSGDPTHFAEVGYSSLHAIRSPGPNSRPRSVACIRTTRLFFNEAVAAVATIRATSAQSTSITYFAERFCQPSHAAARKHGRRHTKHFGLLIGLAGDNDPPRYVRELSLFHVKGLFTVW